MENLNELGNNIPIWMNIYLSKEIIWFLIATYIISIVSFLIIKKELKINMRKDVIVRATAMIWVLSFTADFLALVVLNVIGFLSAKVNIYLPIINISTLGVYIFVVLIDSLIYFYMLRFLFKRLAIDNDSNRKMSIIYCIIMLKWYWLI